MAAKITEDCISCDACAPECPNNAIYPGGDPWNMAEGTNSEDSDEKEALETDYYYIVPEKCTQCIGFYEEPTCIDVCPSEAIIIEPDEEESVLQERYEKLQG